MGTGGGTVMNTKVNIAGVEFKNPVTTASGTFGSGMEYGEFVDCLFYISYGKIKCQSLIKIRKK